MAKKRKGASIAVGGVAVENALPVVQNGLGSALGLGIGGGINPLGFPGSQGAPGTEQVSNTQTLFKNLRWYLVSNDRQLLNEMYVEIGLVRTICDVPVDDALRGGVTIKSEELDEDQIKQLKASLDRNKDLATAGQAAKWNRLFGGAGILVLTDQDPETPLDVATITEREDLEFRAADLWELFYDAQTAVGYNPTTQTQDFEFYSYYGQRVHKSRVMKLEGVTPPSFIKPRLRGWGLSVVESLVRAMNQYLKSTDLLFEVLDEFKVDVYKIKNLVSTLMSAGGEESVRRRVQLANWQKNYQNALTMDSEDDWDHKQLSFAGLGDAMAEIRQQVASDMRMPMLKLFGMPAKGLNASDEDSIEVYNAMVESEIRDKIKYDILRIAEIRCQQLFGYVPEDLTLTFEPLRIMSGEQVENIKTQKYNRLIQTLQAGQMTVQEFREAANKGDIFDITLDPDAADLMSAYDAREVENDPEKGDDTDDPGGDRASTKPKAASAGGAPKPLMKPKNSAAFDRASYEADGGDNWVDARRALFFDVDKAKDKGLWEQAHAASVAAFGETRWQFMVWYYQKHGGKW